MKTIEKTTSDGDIQIFEIIENRKELNSFLKFRLLGADFDSDNIWGDEDSSLSLVSKDNKEICFSYGDKIENFNKANIAKMIETNPSTTIIYGNVAIVQNEQYGDWEANFTTGEN